MRKPQNGGRCIGCGCPHGQYQAGCLNCSKRKSAAKYSRERYLRKKKGLRAKTGPKPKKVALAGEQAAEAYGLNYFIARRRERLGQTVNA